MSRKPFIYLAVPCHGGEVTIHFLSSLVTLQGACRQRGVGLAVDFLDADPLIVRARSRLAAHFLAHRQATHLLFVDADIGFAPQNVFRLFDAGREVAAAVCPLKSLDWDKVRAAAKADAPDLQDGIVALRKNHRAGAGLPQMRLVSLR